MAPHWACGSPIEAELATSGQKRDADCHPSRPSQALLSDRIPGWPQG